MLRPTCNKSALQSAFRFYVPHNDWVAVASLAVIVGAPVVVHHHRMVDAMLRARGKGKQGELKGTRKFFLQQKLAGKAL
jgi:hypothetical protein